MTFPSVYEVTDVLCTVRKTRMWCWFDGDTLHPRWTTQCDVSTPTFQMVDAIDEGFEILTNLNGERGIINFCGIRHYCDDSAVMIAVTRRVTTDTQTAIGFNEGCSLFTGNCAYAIATDDTGEAGCNKILATANTAASCQGSTATCTPRDTCWTTYKICIVDACCVTLAVNGTVEATRTTFLPDVRMQPAFQGRSRAAGTKNSRIRYMEAYNK